MSLAPGQRLGVHEVPYFSLRRIDMKTILSLMAAAIFMAACGAPAGNAPANNTNTNTAKPTAAAPTADALFAMDKAANEAWIKGDTAHFEGMLSDKFVSYEMGKRMSKAGLLKMIGETKCDVKTWSLDDPQMAMINADTYVISYKGTFDGTCGGQKIPSPVRAASVWVRSGDKWQGAFHGENMIIDPTNPPAPPAKPAAKKGEAKKDDKAAADAKPAAPAPDPSTDALMAVEKSLWEAWKARDAKKLEDLTTKDLSFVNIFGTYFATKADTMKDWTEGTCEIKSVNVTDGAGTSLSPTVGILTLKGTADGTCYGQKLGAVVYGTSVYLKDDASWKLAFGFNSPD